MSTAAMPQNREAFPLLRSLLGKEGYLRFQEKCLLSLLSDKDGEIPQETLEKVRLAITHGREILTHEDILNYQTATTRAGGALLKLSIDLPDLQVCNFTKIHADKGKARREITLNRILAEELKADNVLAPRYADEKTGVIATAFIDAQNALDIYRCSDDKSKQIVLDKCLDALLYTYTKTMNAGEKVQKKLRKIVPADNEHYAARLQKRVLDRIAGKKVDASRLIDAYTHDIHNELANEKHVLLHGDPHLSNFVIFDRKAYAIDWERARYGTIFTDIYKLFSRANPDEETKQKLLEKAWNWANKHGIAGSKEDFIRKYGLAEINELLFTTADLVDASRKAPKETKATFEKAANAYYTIAVASARKQRLYELEHRLADTAGAIGVRILPDAEFAQTFSEAGLHVHGLSTLFDHSIPDEKEKIANDIRTNIRRRAKKRLLGRLGLAAAALLAAAGIGTAFSRTEKQPVVQYDVYNDISHRVRTEYPGSVAGFCDVNAWEKNPHVKKFDKHELYDRWSLSLYPDKTAQRVAIPFDQMEKLMYGCEKFIDNDGNTRYGGLVTKYGVKYGLPHHFVNAVFWTNILKAPYRMTEGRDEITLLPYEVLDAVEGKERTDRTIEERVDLSLRHLRECLERSGFSANKAIAEYYFGTEKVGKAEHDAREKQLKNPENFWTYCDFLPEGKELAINTVLAYKTWEDADGADGFMTPGATRDSNIYGAYYHASRKN